jgi:hypothetical protein
MTFGSFPLEGIEFLRASWRSAPRPAVHRLAPVHRWLAETLLR